MRTKKSFRVMGFLILALPILACGPHASDVWKVSGRTLAPSGRPDGKSVHFSIVNFTADPGVEHYDQDFVAVRDVNSNTDGTFTTKFSRSELDGKNQGGYDMRAELSSPPEGQKSDLQFNPDEQSYQDIVLPDLQQWNASSVLDVNETTLSASFALPPKVGLPPGVKGKFIYDPSPVGALNVRDAKGKILWSADTGAQTSVNVTALAAEEESAKLEVSFTRSYQVESSTLSARLAHEITNAELHDRVESVAFQYPSHLPVSRGARCFSDGNELTPCTLTDGALSPGAPFPTSHRVVLQLAAAVLPAHILVRNLALQEQHLDAQMEGSADGMTWVSLGRVVVGYWDLTPPPGTAPVSFLRLTAPAAISGLDEVSVFE